VHSTTNDFSENRSMKIEPYLFFPGNGDAALSFYQQTLGAQVEMVMRYRESPEPPPPGMVPPGWDDKIMHASFLVKGSRVMLSDGAGEETKFGGFSLSLAVESEDEAKRFFDGLAQGGQVHMPLGKTFFSPCFGMVQDRFGVGWMINLIGTPA
jgi:PhnB protein